MGITQNKEGVQEAGARRVVEKREGGPSIIKKKKNLKNLSIQHLFCICCVGQRFQTSS